MNEWKVVEVNGDREWHKDTRKEAEEAVEEFGHMDLEIVGPESNGDNSQEPEIVEEATAIVETEEPDSGQTGEGVEERMAEGYQQIQQMPDDKPTVDEDPVDWMPGHFVDTIQGVPTVNRKGFAVLASQYGVSVNAEPVTLASETDFEYAEFRAVAITKEGQEYTGFGSAHVDRMDGDDKYLLNELAETRAMKRATSWATGIGMTAIEELKGEL